MKKNPTSIPYFEAPLQGDRLEKVFPIRERQVGKSLSYKNNQGKPLGLIAAESNKDQLAG